MDTRFYLNIISIILLNYISYIVAASVFSQSHFDKFDKESQMHPHPSTVNDRYPRDVRFTSYAEYEKTAQFWQTGAQLKLKELLAKQLNRNIAKNVILFLGDGMSIPTLAASRIYLGQLQGHTGEESSLFFENFDHVGLSKTYCIDKQVADSACSATAYLSGIKANYGTIGVTGAVAFNDCEASNKTENQVDSIATWAQRAGKGTGIVTTTRITHASPAGIYSHVGNREWECDTDVLKEKHDPSTCQDIASQLIYNEPGRNLKVILGGGRRKFLPKSVRDEEGSFGQRSDELNLIEDWKRSKPTLSTQYVYNKEDLLNINVTATDYLLGLFESDHLQYNLDANHETEPSISDMTYTAIKILEKEKNGYFLFVEGGRIDHAHHDTKAHKSLDETVQFADAVRIASEMTNPEDTLIVVTSDHAHTMSISGYADRGNNILGLNTEKSDIDKMPYTTLSYANGPGGNYERKNLINDDYMNTNYEYPKLVQMHYETHGGDDVGIFAMGPHSHLFSGVYEQNIIPHLCAFAACIGNGLTACDV